MSSGNRNSFILLQFLTVVRIPLAILLASVLFVFDNTAFNIIITAVIIIALIEISDLLDGYLARKFDIVSEWGAMLDPYADSISRLIVFWGFSNSGLVTPLVPISMAFRDITVAYCRITLTRYNMTVSAKLSGKIKAIIQGVCAFIIVIGPLYWKYTGKWTISALSWIVIIATLGSIVEYAKSAMAAVKS
ncbi:MAG: CDP-alcohol phosphatidyltransferase family protein [Pseudomonadota bacterium]